MIALNEKLQKEKEKGESLTGFAKADKPIRKPTCCEASKAFGAPRTVNSNGIP